jgi:hypothetical protein
MTTIVNNNQRRFFVQSQGLGNQKDIVCNLEHIPQVIKENFEPGEFIIVQYFNRTLKKISNKKLNQLFAAHKINFKIS